MEQLSSLRPASCRGLLFRNRLGEARIVAFLLGSSSSAFNAKLLSKVKERIGEEIRLGDWSRWSLILSAFFSIQSAATRQTLHVREICRKNIWERSKYFGRCGNEWLPAGNLCAAGPIVRPLIYCAMKRFLSNARKGLLSLCRFKAYLVLWFMDSRGMSMIVRWRCCDRLEIEVNTKTEKKNFA